MGTSHMDFLQVEYWRVEDVIVQIKQQERFMKDYRKMIEGYVPKVQAAWVGKDAIEFANDVKTEMLPAIDELIQAVKALRLNLMTSRGTVRRADINEIKKLTEQYYDLVEKI